MTKFKPGDRIRCTRQGGNSFHEDGEYVVSRTITKKSSPTVIMVELDDKGSTTNGWNAEYFELITPTTFEVGKKYTYGNGSVIYTCLGIGKIWVFLQCNDCSETSESLTPIDSFVRYKEYIPPPPEEWRIVYKDDRGTVKIGVHPFTSDSEARESPFWKSQGFKTIRVDQ